MPQVENTRLGSLAIVGALWLFAVLGCAGGARNTVTRQDTSPKIALLSTRTERSSESYLRVYGEIRNISGVQLHGLFAVGNFRDKDGTLINSDSFLVEPSAIPPGGTATFLIMTHFQSDMQNFDIQFRDVWGATVASEDRRPAPNPPKPKKHK